MRKIMVILGTALLTLGFGLNAQAKCYSDSDCGGGVACHNNVCATETAVVLPVMATFARILWKASVTVTGIVTAAAVLVESVPLRAANATVTAIVVGLPA